MIKNACIDSSKKYRYCLVRQWGGDKNNFVNFIMLNPSKADDKIDDPTIKSCIRFAKSNGFDGFYVTNLFAYRATNPNELKIINDPIGRENDKYIEKYVKQCKKIVVAWGNKGILFGRAKCVLEKINKVGTIYCLEINKTGQPKHPLYVKNDSKIIKYNFKI